MPYKITIQDNETKKPIAGSVYLYDGTGTEIGLSGIPVGGADLSDNPAFDSATHIEVNAPGYSSYGIDTALLYESTTIYLVKSGKTWIPYLIGGLIFYIGSNVFGKKSKKKKLF